MDNALSIINSVDLEQAATTIQRITQFQAVVQKQLRQQHDFGVIPGTAKPTLLKPGAEKIFMLLGLTSEYEITEKVQDYDEGFFAFTVKCVLTRNGAKITEGLGHCNTKEAKYAYRWVYERDVPPDMDKSMLFKRQFEGQYGTYYKFRLDNEDPYTVANTCLKMAKKRAQVDAALTVGSLSDIFTQDLEDMDLTGSSIEEKLVEQKVKSQPPKEQPMNGQAKAGAYSRSKPQQQDPEEYPPFPDEESPFQVNESTGEVIEQPNLNGCSECGSAITDKVREFSAKKYGNPLCFRCQANYK